MVWIFQDKKKNPAAFCRFKKRKLKQRKKKFSYSIRLFLFFIFFSFFFRRRLFFKNVIYFPVEIKEFHFDFEFINYRYYRCLINNKSVRADKQAWACIKKNNISLPYGIFFFIILDENNGIFWRKKKKTSAGIRRFRFSQMKTSRQL